MAATTEDVSQALNKVLIQGGLTRIPKKPAHRDIVLGALSLDLRRRYPYSEVELNEYLKEQLAVLNAEVDHVTARRYLVDIGFLKRDRAGERYFLNYLKLTETLADAAQADMPRLITQALRASRPSTRRSRPDS